MPDDIQNKRRYKRFTVDIMGISGKMMFANEVEILDISAGGVSVKVDKRLNIGNEYLLKMENRTKTLSVKGSVVWSVMSGTKKGEREDVIPLYKAGMKFVNIAGEKLLELSRFIEEQGEGYVKQEPQVLSDQRLHVRICLETSRIATLKCPESYKVKKLSLGGMLIEGDHRLEVEDRIPMELFLADDKIGFLGRVASCCPTDGADPERFDIGIEFVEMPGNDTERLNKFISVLEDYAA